MPWFQLLKNQLLTQWFRQDMKLEDTDRGLEAQEQFRGSWSEAEIEALTTAKRKTLFCYASSASLPNVLQSVVLGLDLNRNRILLDEFFPSPAAGVMERTLDLSVPTSDGFLHLEVEIVDKLVRSAHPSLVAKVLSKRFSHGRNAAAKLTFAEGRGPAIALLIPMVPLMRGHVIELSHEGLIASVPQAHRPTLHTRAGACSLFIDGGLEVKTKVQVRQLFFHRKPFRHSSVHLKFEQLQTEQREQLIAFIAQFPEPEQNHHQAA